MIRIELPEYSVQSFHDKEGLLINQNHYLANNLPAQDVALLDKTERAMQGLHMNLPFHNDLHHLTVTTIAVYLAAELHQSLLIPGLIIGGMTHDRGYHWSEERQLMELSERFDSKESLAQALMYGSLPHLNQRDILNQASIAIDGTRVSQTNNTDEIARILGAADRQLIGVNWELYVYNTFKLFQERLLLNPELRHSHSFEDFWKEAGPFLQRFIEMEDVLPEKYFPLAQGKYYDNLKHFSAACFPSVEDLAHIIPDWAGASRDILIQSV